LVRFDSILSMVVGWLKCGIDTPAGQKSIIEDEEALQLTVSQKTLEMLPFADNHWEDMKFLNVERLRGQGWSQLKPWESTKGMRKVNMDELGEMKRQTMMFWRWSK
jgi:hypothetical protein